MKKRNAFDSAYFICFFFLVLVFTASVSGRALLSVKTQQGAQEIMDSGIHPTKEGDFSEVMGMDMVKCTEEDEECFTRRMMADAHLDYIYTQSQDPS